MGLIAPQTSVADRPHRVTLQNPFGPPIPDGDGSYLQPYLDLIPPTLLVKLAPATAKDLERVAPGTVLSSATHILSGPYHPDITTQTRVRFGTRTFSVTGVANAEERNVETIAICVEAVQ